MIRQDGRGKPIYSDKTWSTMCKIGRRLDKLGYHESINKPNLFYKELPFFEDKQTKSGMIYADMRGNKYFPIWDYPQPSIYYQGLPYTIYLRELIILHHSGCDPRFWAYCEPDWTVLESLFEFPTGFCKRCGDDILDTMDYDIFSQDIFDFERNHPKIDQNIEAHYCPDCKEIEYSKKSFQEQYYPGKCEMCKVNDWDVEHHITYRPEVKMNMCRSCHGKIHGHKFPNPLWIQTMKKNKKY